MKTPVIALALAILIVSPAFTQSAIATEAPRTKICDGDPCALIVIRAPIGNLLPRSPAAVDSSGCAEFLADTVKSAIRSRSRVIDAEDDQFRRTIAIEIGCSDIRALVLPGDPVGDLMESDRHREFISSRT